MRPYVHLLALTRGGTRRRRDTCRECPTWNDTCTATWDLWRFSSSDPPGSLSHFAI